MISHTIYPRKVDLVDRISGSIVDIDSITAQEKGCHRTCMSGGHIEYFIALHCTVQSTSAAYTISATVLNDTALQVLHYHRNTIIFCFLSVAS